MRSADTRSIAFRPRRSSVDHALFYVSRSSCMRDGTKRHRCSDHKHCDYSRAEGGITESVSRHGQSPAQVIVMLGGDHNRVRLSAPVPAQDNHDEANGLGNETADRMHPTSVSEA